LVIVCKTNWQEFISTYHFVKVAVFIAISIQGRIFRS
jgi:hypothetical protein